MHLMDNKPAYFDKRDKVIYFFGSHSNHRLKHTDIFVTSLNAIRKQQIQSDVERKKQHIDPSSWNMSYLRIPAPNIKEEQ